MALAWSTPIVQPHARPLARAARVASINLTSGPRIGAGSASDASQTRAAAALGLGVMVLAALWTKGTGGYVCVTTVQVVQLPVREHGPPGGHADGGVPADGL